MSGKGLLPHRREAQSPALGSALVWPRAKCLPPQGQSTRLPSGKGSDWVWRAAGQVLETPSSFPGRDRPQRMLMEVTFYFFFLKSLVGLKLIS